MKSILLSLVWIFTATVICSAQTTLYLPQIADGTQSGGVIWSTAVVVTNPASTGTASGTITFTQSNGAAFNIAFTNPSGNPVGSGNTLPFQLAGGQSSFFVSTAAESLNVGFGTVTSNLPVSVGAVFSEQVPYTTICSGFQIGGTLTFQAGVAAVNPVTRQAISVVNQSNTSTAVAIANPSNSTANISFQLLTTSGVAAFPTVSNTLGANSQTALYVNQLFPNISSSFVGSMQITSSTPLGATSLIFNGGGSFATTPVITLSSLINPAFEWLDQGRWLKPFTSIARLLDGLQLRLG